MRSLAFALAALLCATGCGAKESPTGLKVAPYTFKARDGTVVEAEFGTFKAPENRNNAKSRLIEISFVRFKSTSEHPGDAIVYLAGGPGASGIGMAQGPRFPLFMALREIGDVIALDQRGVGKSNHIPFCKDETPPDVSSPLTRDTMTAYYREELARCFDWWEAQGVDIDGYTTRQSADDLEDLRKALGAKKLNLWGISYGSHLGLAFLKYHEKSVNRAVLAGIEGLDQTVKLPVHSDELIARVQALIDQDPAAKALYPDLAGLMRRVHRRLAAEPVAVTFTPKGKSAPVTMHIGALPLQALAGGVMADPSGTALIPLLYLAFENGQYERLGQNIYLQLFNGPAGFQGMPEAMDLASGISDARLALVEEQAETSIFGDALNFPMPHIRGVRASLDLGDEFRGAFTAATPVLFISGALDGRTSVLEAQEALKQFPNGTHLIVENGGHNIYEADQRVADAVLAFFKGEPVPATILFDPPVFIRP